MPDLSRQQPPEQVPPGQRGEVRTAPIDLADSFTVVVPDFSGEHFYEITWWMPRGDDLPAVGDTVLVVKDDKGEAWVVAWVPG